MLESNINVIESYGYRLDSRADFETMAATAGLSGLVKRATAFPGSHVLWDPAGGEDGYMLVGDNPDELAAELVEFLDLNSIR